MKQHRELGELMKYCVILPLILSFIFLVSIDNPMTKSRRLYGDTVGI